MNLIPGIIPLAAKGGASPLAPFLPMLVIFAIFYLLLIRPQQKRQKQQETMIGAITKGDRVTTAGGLCGTVVEVTDDVLTLEIASLRSERVRVEVRRSKIESVEKKSKGGEES